MGKRFTLSTKDNPYNPFDNYRNWFVFDVTNGYNTAAYLARISADTDNMSDYDAEKEIERAIDEIIRYDFTGNYIKVYEDDIVKPVQLETAEEFKKHSY